MKRMLFISSNIHTPWGGSEALWYKTAVFLKTKKSKIEVAVITKKWPIVPGHIQEIADAGGIICDYPVPPTTPIEYLKSKFRKSIEGQKKTLIQRFSPDLILHSMGKSFEGGDWMKIANDLAIPYVNLIHLASELQWPDNDEIELYRKGYKNAFRNFFVSQDNRNVTCKQLGLEITNYDIVRNPISVSRKILPYPETGAGFHLSLPAALVPIHKGQDILFEVLAQAKWKQRPLHLNLFGTGYYSASLQYYCHYLGLKNVHFKGYASNIDEVWSKNHILIMSSRMEGLPLTLVEAMSCGRAAIVTAVAGMKDCIQDGETGYIAQGAHPEFLDDALERAWQGKDHWQNMGVLAAERMKELIPFEPTEEFAKILLSLLK
ncbi:MAG: glycosyltransferase family 4 protein [Proteobacteria bacterium]|nr:glycosyltransferase family 4 protein [Pseudomonadota bacterium]